MEKEAVGGFVRVHFLESDSPSDRDFSSFLSSSSATHLVKAQLLEYQEGHEERDTDSGDEEDSDDDDLFFVSLPENVISSLVQADKATSTPIAKEHSNNHEISIEAQEQEKLEEERKKREERLDKFRAAGKKILFRIKQRVKALQLIGGGVRGRGSEGAECDLRSFGSGGAIFHSKTCTVDDIYDAFSRELGYRKSRLLGPEPELWVTFPRLGKRERIVTSTYLQCILNRQVSSWRERKLLATRKLLCDLASSKGDVLALGVWQFACGPDYRLEHLLHQNGIVDKLVKRASKGEQIAVGALWKLAQKSPEFLPVMLQYYGLAQTAVKSFPDGEFLVGLLATIAQDADGLLYLSTQECLRRLLQLFCVKTLDKPVRHQVASILASCWPRSLKSMESILKQEEEEALERQEQDQPPDSPLLVYQTLVQCILEGLEQDIDVLELVPSVCVLSQLGQAYPECEAFLQVAVIDTSIQLSQQAYKAWCEARKRNDKKRRSFLDVLLQCICCIFTFWVRGHSCADLLNENGRMENILHFLTSVFATNSKRNQIQATHMLVELFEKLDPIPPAVSQQLLSRLRLCHNVPEISKIILGRAFSTSELCAAMNEQGALTVVLNMMRHYIKDRNTLFLASKAALLLAFSPNLHSFSISLLLSLLQSSTGDARNSLLCVLYGVAVEENELMEKVLHELAGEEDRFELLVRVLTNVSVDFFKPFFEIVCLVLWRMFRRFNGPDSSIEILSNKLVAHLQGNCAYLRSSTTRYMDYKHDKQVPANAVLNVSFEKETQMWCAVSFKRSILESSKTLPQHLRTMSTIIGFFETQRAAVHAFVEFEKEKEHKRNRFLDPISKNHDNITQDSSDATGEDPGNPVDPFQLQRVSTAVTCRARILLSSIADLFRMSKERLAKKHGEDVRNLLQQIKEEREKRKVLQEKEETCLELDEIPASRQIFRKLEKLQKRADKERMKELLRSQKQETCTVHKVLFSKEIVAELFFMGLNKRFDACTRQIAAWILWELLFEQDYLKETKLASDEIAKEARLFPSRKHSFRQKSFRRLSRADSYSFLDNSFKKEGVMTPSSRDGSFKRRLSTDPRASLMDLLGDEEEFSDDDFSDTEQTDVDAEEYSSSSSEEDSDDGDAAISSMGDQGLYHPAFSKTLNAKKRTETPEVNERPSTTSTKADGTREEDKAKPKGKTKTSKQQESLRTQLSKTDWLFGRQRDFYTTRYAMLLTNLSWSGEPSLELSAAQLLMRLAMLEKDTSLQGLSSIGKVKGIEALLKLLKSSCADVQYNAALALRKLTSSTVHQELMSLNGGFNTLLKLQMDERIDERTRKLIEEILVPLRRHPCNGTRLYQVEMKGVQSEHTQRPSKKVSFSPAVSDIQISSTPRTKGAYKIQLKPLLFSECYNSAGLPTPQITEGDIFEPPRSPKARRSGLQQQATHSTNKGPTFVFFPRGQNASHLSFDKYLAEDPKHRDAFWDKSLAKFDKVGKHVLTDVPLYQAPDGKQFHLFLQAAIPQQPIRPERARVFESALKGLLEPLDIKDICALRNFERLPGEPLSALLLRFSQLSTNSGSEAYQEELRRQQEQRAAEEEVMTSSIRSNRVELSAGLPPVCKSSHPLLGYLGRKLGVVLDQQEDELHFYFVSGNQDSDSNVQTDGDEQAEQSGQFGKRTRFGGRHRATTLIAPNVDSKSRQDLSMFTEAQMLLLAHFQAKGDVGWNNLERDHACMNQDCKIANLGSLSPEQSAAVLQVAEKNASLLLGMFRFYCVDHSRRDNVKDASLEPFCLNMMKSTRFWKILDDCGLLKNATKVQQERYELAFLSTIATSKVREPGHPSQSLIPESNQCFSFNKHLQAAYRHEFLACLLRVAMIRYPQTPPPQALETMIQDDLDHLRNESLIDLNFFRITKFQNKAIFDTVFQQGNALKTVFDRFAGINECSKSWGGSKSTRMSLPDWIDMLESLPCFTVANQVSIKAFALSLNQEADEFRRWEQTVSLSFPQFVEAVARLADMSFWPNEDLLAQVSAESVVEFFEFMHNSLFFHQQYDDMLRPFLGSDYLAQLACSRPANFEYKYLENLQTGLPLEEKLKNMIAILLHTPLQEEKPTTKKGKRKLKREIKKQRCTEWLYTNSQGLVKTLSFHLASGTVVLGDVVLAHKAFSYVKKWVSIHGLEVALQTMDDLLAEFDDAMQDALRGARDLVQQHLESL